MENIEALELLVLGSRKHTPLIAPGKEKHMKTSQHKKTLIAL